VVFINNLNYNGINIFKASILDFPTQILVYHFTPIKDDNKRMTPTQPGFQVTCQNCGFNSVCFPRGLTKEEISQLEDVVQRRKVLHKGEFLFRNGDAFEGLIAIKSGMAKLVYHNEQSEEHIVQILLPGEILGFGAIAQQKHRCSAQALDTLSYCELPAHQLHRICFRIPTLLDEILRHASDAISNQRTQTLFIKKPAEQRLAAFLLDLSERYAFRGFSGEQFSIGFTRQELGNYLDLALATVSRTLKQFEKNGWLEVRGKWIRILDRQALEKLFASDRLD